MSENKTKEDNTSSGPQWPEIVGKLFPDKLKPGSGERTVTISGKRFLGVSKCVFGDVVLRKGMSRKLEGIEIHPSDWIVIGDRNVIDDEKLTVKVEVLKDVPDDVKKLDVALIKSPMAIGWKTAAFEIDRS